VGICSVVSAYLKKTAATVELPSQDRVDIATRSLTLDLLASVPELIQDIMLKKSHDGSTVLVIWYGKPDQEGAFGMQFNLDNMKAPPGMSQAVMNTIIDDLKKSVQKYMKMAREE